MNALKIAPFILSADFKEEVIVSAPVFLERPTTLRPFIECATLSDNGRSLLFSRFRVLV